jgi:hypothetical protein
LRRRPAAAASGPLLVIAVAMGSGAAGKPVKVAEIPHAIAVTPDGKTATNTVERPIKVGHGPTAIAIRP